MDNNSTNGNLKGAILVFCSVGVLCISCIILTCVKCCVTKVQSCLGNKRSNQSETEADSEYSFQSEDLPSYEEVRSSPPSDQKVDPPSYDEEVHSLVPAGAYTITVDYN